MEEPVDMSGENRAARRVGGDVCRGGRSKKGRKMRQLDLASYDDAARRGSSGRYCEEAKAELFFLFSWQKKKRSIVLLSYRA